MTWLKTDRQFELSELARVDASRLPGHEANAIRFCCDWIEGKKTFEFKTSGSSGSPTRISFSREQLEASARMTEKATGLRAGFTALVCLDTQFIAGAMMLVRSLVTGMNIILKKPSANPLEGLSDQVDFAAFVPYQLTEILKEHRGSLDRLRVILIGGAPVNNELAAAVSDLHPAVYATYGMTETISHIAMRRLNGPHPQKLFELLPGISASIDSRGCLVLSAPPLGIPSIVTNDCVNLTGERQFVWTGRFDRVINSGSIKIQAETVEKTVERVLKELRIDRRFFVAGLPDEKLGERVALVLEGALRPHEEERIMAALRNVLGKYEVPRQIHLVAQFEETATQKVDRLRTLERIKLHED